MKKQAYQYGIVLACLLLPSQIVFAQSNSVGDYVPPPLFGGSSTVEKETKNHLPSEVIQLRKNENDAPTPQEAKNLKKLKALRAAKLKNSDIPIPKKKPSRVAAVEKEIKRVASSPKSLSQGIVTGPKTMPAVKKKSVEAEVLEGVVNTPVQTDMLARVQKKEVPVETLPVKEKVEEKKNAASLLTDRLVLVFQAGEATLSDNKMAMLLEQVVPAVNEGNGHRLNITAYASPNTTTLNADKRLALSRGLAVRGYLMQNGVNPSQINVRSLGSDTKQQPYDRVEIVLIQ